MNKTALAVVAIVLYHSTSFARIGETYGELVKRYGQPHVVPGGEDMPESYDFAFQRLGIRVYVLNGRSVCESFIEHETPLSEGQRGWKISDAISDSTKDMVLGANSRGKRWQPIASVIWYGDQWDRGADHPFTKSKLLNAWKLDGQRLFCTEERLSRITRGGWCELTVFTPEWSEFMTKIVQKCREKELKKSGL